MKILVAMIVSLFLVGCTTVGMNVGQFPKYSASQVNPRWEEMVGGLEQQEMEMQQVVMLLAMAGAEPSDEELAAIKKIGDELTYYKAALQMQLYHEDFVGAKKSFDRASELIGKILDMLQVMAERLSI